ncbi:hypothetical protein GY632_0827 [Trichophyton interdigitale]|uniref:Uncharacterized protein n=1 Tax=Trichophyton interdigitale TaxID=101480 RepID=A0A9P5CWS2_9EURO|nr:hypothetical protein GY632_0827 [Trichophyton interdigitale]
MSRLSWGRRSTTSTSTSTTTTTSSTATTTATIATTATTFTRRDGDGGTASASPGLERLAGRRSRLLAAVVEVPAALQFSTRRHGSPARQQETQRMQDLISSGSEMQRRPITSLHDVAGACLRAGETKQQLKARGYSSSRSTEAA